MYTQSLPTDSSYDMKKMMRTSLLINCSEKEASEVRARAQSERRTVSGYVVNVLNGCMETSDGLVKYLRTAPSFKLDHSKKPKLVGPRTTLHIYCAAEEATQIRHAADLRQVAMSHFVLSCLHRYWEIEDRVKKRRADRLRELA
jgi:hypothetical protein